MTNKNILGAVSAKQRFSATFEIERGKITTMPELFQGREGAYAHETVDKIVREGFDKSQDTIIVWYNEDLKKYVVISGHSRWAASEILYKNGNKDLAKMPVKQFIGDKEEAIEYAVLESNRSGTAEGFKSDLRAYKLAVSHGYNKERLKSLFKPDSYLRLLQDLSGLNENGRFIEYMGTDSEKSFPYLQRNASWIGDLRKQFPKLTHAHEAELFDYFYTTKKGLTILKADFYEMMHKKLMDVYFDPSKALNLENKKYEAAKKTPAQEEVNELNNNIDKLNKERIYKEEIIFQYELLPTLNEEQQLVLSKFKERTAQISKALRANYEKRAILESQLRRENNTVKPDLFFNTATPVKTTVVKAISLPIVKAKLKLCAVIQGEGNTLNGFFGTIFKQFKNKPKEAIKHLLKVKEGECTNALYRDDIGYIDIVWGENDANNKGFGLKHIVEKHGEEIKQLGFNVEDFIPIVVQFGDLTTAKEKSKILLESKMFRVVLLTEWKGTEKKFILTAFDLRKSKGK